MRRGVCRLRQQHIPYPMARVFWTEHENDEASPFPPKMELTHRGVGLILTERALVM